MTQIEAVNLERLIKQVHKGNDLSFKDIPEHLFDDFWNRIERDHSIVINEFSTGIKSKYNAKN